MAREILTIINEKQNNPRYTLFDPHWQLIIPSTCPPCMTQSVYVSAPDVTFVSVHFSLHTSGKIRSRSLLYTYCLQIMIPIDEVRALNPFVLESNGLWHFVMLFVSPWQVSFKCKKEKDKKYVRVDSIPPPRKFLAAILQAGILSTV